MFTIFRYLFLTVLADFPDYIKGDFYDEVKDINEKSNYYMIYLRFFLFCFVAFLL